MLNVENYKIFKNSRGRKKITQSPTTERREKPSVLNDFCVSFLSVFQNLHVLLYFRYKYNGYLYYYYNLYNYNHYINITYLCYIILNTFINKMPIILYTLFCGSCKIFNNSL